MHDKQQKNQPRLHRIVIVVAATLVGPAAFAQVRPDAGTILEQERKRVPEPARPDREVLPKEPPPRPALKVLPELRVTVTRFRITGNTVFPEAELLEAVKDLVGKELDFNGLNEAATRLRAHYRARGYFLAQAYLPEQKIHEGVVEIAVLEGRLGNIELRMMKPDSRLRPGFARGILNAHLKEGDLITETGLERPLLLLSDLPNVEVSSEIGPSRTTVGAADLRVNLAERPGILSGYVDFDNGGNRFTGEYRLGLNLNANNLTGWGDQVSLRGFITDESMSFGRLAWVVPVWYYGTRVGVSYATFDYRLAKDFAALQAHGTGSVTSVYALHPFVRTRSANLIGQIAFENKVLKDRVDSTGIVEDRKINAGRLGLVGDLRDRVFGGGLNSFSLTYTTGKLDLEPPNVLAADQAPATGLRTQGGFNKTSYELRRLQRLTDDFNLLFALSGQEASKNLASAEKMSLGGPQGVRAYPVGEASGDSGYLATGEIRYIVPKFKLGGGDVTLAGFYDAGRVKSNENPLPAAPNNVRNIAGYGFGLSLGKDNDFLIRASVAWRADERPTSDPADRAPRVWFQTVKWF